MSNNPNAVSPLRRRMIEDMTIRRFTEKTQSDYIRHVRAFAAFLGRSPELAEPEDLRRFQRHMAAGGARPATMNAAVSALRFFFQTTLGRAGFRIVGADQGGRPYWDVDLRGPLVVVLGGEDKGLTPAILKRCDEIATIPLRAGLDSLNVSVAAGVLVFERARQRAHP